MATSAGSSTGAPAPALPPGTRVHVATDDQHDDSGRIEYFDREEFLEAAQLEARRWAGALERLAR